MNENNNSIRNLIAPDVDTKKARHDKFVEVSRYLIIGIISIILLFLVPLLTGCLKGDIGLEFPKTTEGWIIYIIIKVATAAASVAIFVLFSEQAEVNVKTDSNYILAKQILQKEKPKKYQLPRSPKKLKTKLYTKKSFTVFISSITSTIVITNLLISFDIINFISCVVSVVTSIIFGWTTMLKNEVYWTDEFLRYAKYITGYKEE